jgi:hypothetical protein
MRRSNRQISLRKTESVTVRVTKFVCLTKLRQPEIVGFKSGRTQSFLTGSTFRGEALKERSEGSWRSGRRRSEGCRRRGHGQRFSFIPCRAANLLSTPCARKPHCRFPIANCQLVFGIGTACRLSFIYELLSPHTNWQLEIGNRQWR